MFTDESRCTIWNQTRQLDLRAFQRFLTPELMRKAAQFAGTALRSCPLNWANMAWLGMAAALHTTKNFADILIFTFKLLDDAGIETPGKKASAQGKKRRGKKGGKKHSPYGNSFRTVSEEAFVQARRRMPMDFWLWLLLLLSEDFQAAHPECVYWKDYRLLSIDGTEIAMPYWQTLGQAFGTCRNGRGRRRPHARMLMMAFPLARMPWIYELAPRSCHEQTAAWRLFQRLQARDLVLMDRGFWNYHLFWQIQRQGAFFAIRLRSGVSLKKRRSLGKSDTLVEWKRPRTKNKRRACPESPDTPESLTLRVVRYQVRGFRPSAVVTNVLDPQSISREEWVRMATVNEEGQVLEQGLYHRRWEIETLFCELKVRQGLEGSLRSRTEEGVAFEVAGHVLLYSMVRRLMAEAAAARGVSALRISFSQALREVEDMRQTLLTASPQRVARVLLPRLIQRIAEHVVPLRPGRHYPRPADKYKKKKYRQSAKLLTKKT
jgi:hypothetical protein